MKSFTAKENNRGFTLIELLIVVVILGILAAVVIPQLSGATDDAKAESLKTNLTNLRTAIEMYEYEHGSYPGVATSGAAASCNTTGTTGNGSLDTKEAVADQLTMYSNSAGVTCDVYDSVTYKYGPYLKTPELGTVGFPANSVTSSNIIVMQLTGNLTMISAVQNGGWKYDNISGKIIADHSAYDNF